MGRRKGSHSEAEEKEPWLTAVARHLAGKVCRDLPGREVVGEIVERLGRRTATLRPKGGDEKLLGSVAKALGIRRTCPPVVADRGLETPG